MLFFSPFSAYRVTGIRNEATFCHPVTGFQTGKVEALRAEFAKSYSAEREIKDPLTGEMMKIAEIQGNYFDTEAAQITEKWPDEDRLEVERVLLRLCETRPDQIKLVPVMEPVIMSPWPNYSQADAETAVQYAKDLGLVREALAYEHTQESRQRVIEQLEDEIATWVDDEGNPLPDAPLKNSVTPEKPVLKPKVGGEPADTTGSHEVPAAAIDGVITV